MHRHAPPVGLLLALCVACTQDPENPSTSDPVDDPIVEPDTVAPEVTATTPADGAVDVDVEVIIEISLTEEVSTASAELAMQLTDALGEVPVAVTVDGPQVTLVPDAPLDGETAYTLVVGTELEDLAGNALAAAVTVGFTTADVEGPRLVGSTPAQGAIEVDIDAPIVLEFTEELDPASVDATTVVVSPIGVVDGVTYAEGDALPVDLDVKGAFVTVTPQRGALQEYETTYVVIADGVRDRAGNPSARETVSFETLMLDEDYSYRIYNAQFGMALDTFGDTNQAYLVDTGAYNTSGSYWHPVGTHNGDLLLANAFLGDKWFLEGGNAKDPAVMTGGYYTGQYWGAIEVEPLPGAGAGDSPSRYNLENAFFGPGWSLGVMYDTGSFMIVGLEEEGWLDQLWYFHNEGSR